MSKRTVRMALLACASIAAVGLVAGTSPAAAKAKTKTVHKTFAQCQNAALSLAAATDTPSPPPGSSPIQHVDFRGIEVRDEWIAPAEAAVGMIVCRGVTDDEDRRQLRIDLFRRLWTRRVLTTGSAGQETKSDKNQTHFTHHAHNENPSLRGLIKNPIF